MQGGKESPRRIGSYPHQGIKNGTPSCFSGLIQGFTYDYESKGSALEGAVADDFSEGLLPCPVKDIGDGGGNSGDVFGKRGSEYFGPTKRWGEDAKVGKSSIGAVRFDECGQLVSPVCADH